MEKLNILGTVVDISDSLVQYNKIRKEFIEKSQKASLDYQAIHDKYGSYTKFIDNFEDDAWNILFQNVSDCTKVLVDNGILEVDDDRFCEENKYIGEPLASVIREVNGAFQKVDDKLRNNVAVREARKENRGRYVGGGFGMGAAIEASVKAGALNMATGAAHSIVNSIGNSLDRSSASEEKEHLYHLSKTKLCNGVYDAVFRCHIALIKYLAQFNIDKRPYNGMITDSAKKNAKVILNNADKIDDNNDCRAALIDSLIKDPYQPKWYDFALKRFGDADGTLEAAAEYFGCDEIRRQKRDMVSEFAKDFSLETEDKALHALEEIKRYKTTIHFQGTSDIEKEIEKELKRFDELARTVDGILFDTRDEAKIARQEYEIIQKRLTELDRSNINDLKAARDFFEGLQSKKLVKEYNEEINEQIADLDFAEKHHAEVKKAKVIGKASLVMLGLIIVGSYFFPITTSEGLYHSKMQILSIPLIVQGHELVETPTFINGVMNGIGVFGRSVGDMVVGGISEYIDGFSGGWFWKLIWLVLGIVWISIKQILAVIPRMIVSTLSVFFQHGTWGYHVGFILGIMLPMSCIVWSSGENNREKVDATKNITKNQAIKATIIILGIALFSILVLDRF